MKLIVIEGTDGSGKSHHTDALAARLHAAGIAAESYHHPPAPTRDPYRAALHYATARAEFCQWAPSRLVYVVDRWIESTVAVGWTLDAKTHKAERNALWRLATAERAILPAASLVVVLDTTDDELDRRLLTRGHSVTDVDRACRAVYRDPSVLGPWGAVRVDTSGDVAAVETRLLAMALARLGRIDDAADLWHEAREAPECADVAAPRLARGLWGKKGVRTYARVNAELRDDGRTVYTGVAGHTITEGTGGRDAVVTEEYASSEDAWTALVGALKARRGRR